MRGPASTALSVLAALLLASGCDTAEEAGPRPGATLRVYVSVPLRGAGGSAGADIAEGAKLALADAGGRAGGFGIDAVVLDDTRRAGGAVRWSQAQAAANAREASSDSAAIAYVGELESGATRASLPITNQARLPHVSPASTAIDLVRAEVFGDEVPELVQPTGERNFARVVPDDEAQAGAAAAWGRGLDPEALAVVSDRSAFGELMAGAVIDAAASVALPVAEETDPGDLPSLVYLAAQPRNLPPLLRRARSAGARPMTGGALMLAPPALRAAPRGTLAVSSAQAPGQLPIAGRRMLRRFRQRFGRPPGRYAAYGYEAMALLLDAIERAAAKGAPDREAVIDALFATEDRESVLGAYSIDRVGDTTLDRLAGYRVRSDGPSYARPLRTP